jgi:hypothetical protein
MKDSVIGRKRPCQELFSPSESPRRFDQPQGLSMRARAAASACVKGEPEASQLWYSVLQECRQQGIDPISILSIPHESGRTLAGVVMTSRDWDSCQVLHEALADGVYLIGYLVREQDRILYKLGEGDTAIGVQFWQNGARYGGEFRKGMRHDRHGVLDFNTGVTYDGGFLYGKMTGWGRASLTWQQNLALEGAFLDGEFLGNPRTVMPCRGVRQGFLRQCRKLMELRP